MSMVARFVEVAAGSYAELLDDSRAVNDLLTDEAASPGPFGVIRQMRGTAGQLQHIVAASLAKMDSAARKELADRLESTGAADLPGGKHGDELLGLMLERLGSLFAMAGAGAPADPARARQLAGCARLSLATAWHGIHYLLSGSVEPGTTLVSQAILGGTEIAGGGFGHGAARYFTPPEVVALANELAVRHLEGQIKARFDPAEMERLGIYPGGWTPARLNWLMYEYRNLRDFFGQASRRQSAVFTCIV